MDMCGAKGLVVCRSSSRSAVHAWGANWAPMCQIDVTPVIDDAAARAVLSSKPMYQL